MTPTFTTPGTPRFIPRKQLTKVKEYPAAAADYAHVFQCVMRPPAAPEVLTLAVKNEQSTEVLGQVTSTFMQELHHDKKISKQAVSQDALPVSEIFAMNLTARSACIANFDIGVPPPRPPLPAVVRSSTLMTSASTTLAEPPVIPREQLIKLKEYPAVSGGFGHVYQCIMRAPAGPDIVVAVKAIFGLTDDASRKRAHREMILWMQARHENIVPMLGITEGFSEEGFAMVSPWMKGGTLAEYVEGHKGNMPCMKKLTLIKDIASGLAYLHSRRVVHGNLRPNNIMLDDNERALLIDCGLSNSFGVFADIENVFERRSATPSNAVRFAAPEVVAPLFSVPDVPSDNYSLGCVMLNVFTEKQPWYGYHDAAVAGAHHAGKSIPTPTHSHLSEKRKQFICKCTSVQVDRRPSSQDAVVFIEEQLDIEDTPAPIRQLRPEISSQNTLTVKNEQSIEVLGQITSTFMQELNHDKKISKQAVSQNALPVFEILATNMTAHSACITNSDIGIPPPRHPLPDVVRSSTLMTSASTTPAGPPVIPREQFFKLKEWPAASGGFGHVYQCIMRLPAGPDVEVAVKAIFCLTDDASKKRARREMKLWMQARHENIVPMLGITEGFSEEGFAMVSPWMKGGTLADYVEGHKGNMSCMNKLTLIKDIASGLAYLHSRQIVHGDLTTRNIILDDSERALLIDFGLSNVLGGMVGSCLSLSAARPGAVRFAAPELLGMGEQTNRPTGDGIPVEDQLPMPDMPSDIYSLGCVMLNILTEKHPWSRYRDLAVAGAHHSRKSIPIPDHNHLSRKRKQFIRKCTSIQVSKRPSSQDAVTFIQEELRIEANAPPIQQSKPDEHSYTIVIAGAVGSGKSSLVNLLSGKHVAHTSNDARRCTTKWRDYSISFGDTAYRVFDTVGFVCSNDSPLGPKERSEKYAKQQIRAIHEQGGIDLLLLCAPSRNFRVETVLNDYQRIQDELRGRQVPVVLVITHFEEPFTIEKWWSTNSSTFRAQLNSIANHICITSIHDKYLDESREHIFQMIAQYHTPNARQ